MAEMDVEGFRNIPDIFTPDFRSTIYSIYENGNFRRINLEDHHANIDSVRISEKVPKEIKTQFDTAKNLSLYSWYVYRFGPVAEHQAYVTFEFALRERLKATIQKPLNPPGFKTLLQMAVDQGLLKNEGFSIWHRRKEETRYRNEQDKGFYKMIANELNPLPEEVDYL